MKMKVSLLVCTASLFVAYPILAQRHDGDHGHHGNNSNHSGHDDDGNSGGHRQDDHDGNGNNSNHSGHDDDGNSGDHRQDGPHGHGDRNLVLASPSATAAVATAMTSVTTTLKSGSLRTSAGAVIPSPAQSRTYALLAAGATQPTSAAEMSAALSTAGPEAGVIVPTLVTGFSGLRSNPAQLPSVIATYNRFTKAASTGFISNPPPEFLALHTVLARLTAAAAGAK